MIKLCYKEYPFKISLKACKVFFDQTGLDLQTVFMKYIVACAVTREMGTMERVVHFSELYTRHVASQALHSIINEECDGVSIAEIDDATYRVGWAISERDDDVSEPWPMVMLDTALQINEHFARGEDVKKPDTSAAD
tara:strand:- start:10 stop:420 length:411 start_codon:yes stop_codon:yes gene_type:complete